MSALFDALRAQFDATGHVGYRGLRDDSDFARQPIREAAVLIPITDRAQPGVLLTQRPETMAKHPGQIAFPGGKWEDGEDAVAAALREAEEELAIPPSEVRIVGAAQSFVTGTGFNLTPVLGVVRHDLPITPDPREVDGWFEAPLSHVLDRANHKEKIGIFLGNERPYIEIDWQGWRIWGITAGILAHLSYRLDWKDLVTP
ncbi:CoA pyrophosphatase [Aurantiacibacter gangjinensis]|uniref:NUDIX hydrolase n=1 Tax=Aurantiacibacter gangjinensis TaxID=502682 RepID=A0A0G9MRR9_9SPHN|nr:CoA pyrophosphatase [Aurantiacibacter gangjinensis]APE29178.1 putative nudix hydrolase YeaB [Aurantiacibacter gangjinensis]KLE33244.1 NUDIX hydrolase [Aurantiacibacter gangjinensis]